MSLLALFKLDKKGTYVKVHVYEIIKIYGFCSNTLYENLYNRHFTMFKEEIQYRF